ILESVTRNASIIGSVFGSDKDEDGNGFPHTATETIPADHRRDSLPHAGPSGVAAELHLAGSGSGAGVSCAAEVSRFLEPQPGWQAAFRQGRIGGTDPSCRDQICGRLLQPALIL